VAETLKKVGRALLRLAASYGPLLIASVSAEEGGAAAINKVASDVMAGVAALGGLLFAISAALFGVGLAAKFLPWGSQRTKDFGGAILDHGIILACLAAAGLFILAFAAEITASLVGAPAPPKPSSPWGQWGQAG